MPSFQFIDLFSGCGGFSTGLEMSGHQCLLGVDFNKEAIQTFAANHPHAQSYCGDIRELSSAKLKELLAGQKVDMVVGGPPCQGFSTVGRGQVRDERNQLFREFVRIVELLRPKMIIMENVTGLLAHKNRAILEAIFAEFEALGFTMEARVLSAEEYGVPSRRRRTFIMGANAAKLNFPLIEYGPRGMKPFVTVNKALRKLRALDGKIYNHAPEQAQIKNPLERERLHHVPEGRGIRYQRDQEEFLPKKLYYPIDWDTMRERRFRQTRLQRLDGRAPAPTILTSRTMYYHHREHRYLTPREAAACQSFPNDFVFSGSQTAVFRQIGNAVPPVLAMALGEAIKEIRFRKRRVAKKLGPKKDFHRNAFRYDQHTAI